MSRNKRRWIALLAGLLLASGSVTAFAEEGEGPKLDQVHLTRHITAPGGELTVSANAFDPDGIKSLYVCFVNDRTGETLTVPLQTDIPGEEDGGDPYSALLKIPTDAEEGIYTLDNVILIDEQDHRSRYFREERMKEDRDDVYQLPQTLQFTVLCDDEAPALESCRPEQSTVEPGNKLKLEVCLHGEISGFLRGTLTFQNSRNGHRISCTLGRDDRGEDGVYRPELEIPVYEPAGKFTLLRATLQDVAGNQEDYASNGEEGSLPLPVSCDLEVTPGQLDSTAPVLQWVSLGGSRVDGDQLEYEVRAKATDVGSGVDHLTLRFQNDQNNRSVSLTLGRENLKDGVYTGWLKINRFEPQGVFVLDNVGVTDYADNYQGYCRPKDVKEENHKLPLPKQLELTVQTGCNTLDDTAPILRALQVSPDEAGLGGTFDVTATVTDDFSGVDQVQAQFKSASGKSILLTLLEENGSFVGTVKKSQTQEAGVYHLWRVSVTDHAGNRRTYYRQPDEHSEPLPVQAAFTIKNNS